MFIDLTLEISPKMVKSAEGNEKKALVGHIGTHFDVMNQQFPIDYIERKAVVFDVSHIRNRDIMITDIESNSIQKNMFVAFYTSFIEDVDYGSAIYFKDHPQLANDLIELLIEREVSIIGIDCAGIRRGLEHTKTDQYCAEHNVFVVENLCNLKAILHETHEQCFIANTYPVKYTELTGLPCRVVAKL